ncbi:hypothetical protein K0T92_03650 [Paenibacillus oenotherae]|uniref:Uncharacterized protein n=1 Tax=Paenibacillus oenotherae TaxID=1435645 RepID=A0ABS7D1M1_9BACL|nr:hypothetical protein [Paenibacillus oenotherae]MBW7473837.1 hypothetical protein [Paenibacillus oenotherae]
MLDNRKKFFRGLVANEEGSVLLYCLLILIVLMVVTPLILMNVSTEKLSSTRNEDNILVHTLASSAMEEFLTHIDSGGTIQASIHNYKGWGTKSITLPNGKVARLEQQAYINNVLVTNVSSLTEVDFVSPAPGVTVVIRASSGKSVVKEYRYLIKGTKSSLVINPDAPVNVSLDTDPNKSYILTKELLDAPSLKNFDHVGIGGASGAIEVFRAAERAKINQEITNFKAKSETHFINNGTIVSTVSYPSGAGFVKANSINFDADDITLTINGNLYVAGPLEFNKKRAKLHVTGDLYVEGIVRTNNDGPGYIEVDGNMYAAGHLNVHKDGDKLIVGKRLYVGDVFVVSDALHGIESEIKAESIFVANAFEVKGYSKLTVSKFITASRMDMINDKSTDITARDLFIKHDIKASGAGAFKLNVSGLIVAADKIDFNNDPPSNSFSPAGTSTALQCGNGGVNIFSGCNGGIKYDYGRK